jgi:hypothetical protein
MEKDDYLKNLKSAIGGKLLERLTPEEERLKSELEDSARMGKLTDMGKKRLQQLKDKEYRN